MLHLSPADTTQAARRGVRMDTHGGAGP